MNDTKIPRLTADLIELLDTLYPAAELDLSAEGRNFWAGFSESTVRAMAFAAGQRKIVEDLKAWLEESSDGDSDSEDTGDLYGSVLEADGHTRKQVASVQLATPLA